MTTSAEKFRALLEGEGVTCEIQIHMPNSYTLWACDHLEDNQGCLEASRGGPRVFKTLETAAQEAARLGARFVGLRSTHRLLEGWDPADG